MDIRSILALFSLVPGPAVAQAREAVQGVKGENVIVYVRSEDVPFEIQYAAEARAEIIFASVGVRIEWRSAESAALSAEQPIVVELVVLPPNSPSHPLAYALPYEGVHVRIFYDRVAQLPNRAVLLGHVLVHEITHILQGVSRHSATGIMKARWTVVDLNQMPYKALPFTPRDVTLIHRGVVARAAATGEVAAKNSEDEIADSH